ncbi:MAG TPA: penicillin-binding transpeptidase domain-containing protein, partial [Aggregatilineales bacterium]|nr:penicillin-binding transpeptidase domain-containing protein [Aggregatilineales bacterium]
MLRRTGILTKQKVLWIALLIILAACDGGNNSGGDLLGLSSGPTAAVSLDQGLQTAATYLDAWAAQDYVTMYGLLSPNAQDAYPPEDFTEIYEQIWEDLHLQSIAWQQGDSLLQGTTAVIQYNLTFQSRILGEFTDPNRLLRLIPVDGVGMRIAWSRMDIFEGWAGGARLQVERFLPNRGNIYDNLGRPMADQNGIALPVYLVKNDIPGINQCIEALIPILGREYQELEQLFNLYNADTLFFAGEMDPETYRVRGANLEAACRPQIDERPTRRYFASVAPHVIGYVSQIPAEQAADYNSRGYPADAMVGVSGIEQAWEDELRGTIGNRLSLFSVTDERLRIITEKRAQPGESVYLTLNRDLQKGIQEAFAQAYSFSAPTWAQTSPGAAAVVLDVNTGAVLAMVSYPGFDPAVFSPDSPYLDPGSVIQGYQTDFQTPLVNRATQGRYPLGSVFKLVSSIAGTQSGLVPFDNLNNCTGTWNGELYGDITRTDWYRDGHGVLDGRGAIINSCNPYFWQLSVTLNNTDAFLLPNYARMLGFGAETGLRGIEEDAGLIPDPDYRASQGFTWGQSDASNLVIGQGDVA